MARNMHLLASSSSGSGKGTSQRQKTDGAVSSKKGRKAIKQFVKKRDRK